MCEKLIGFCYDVDLFVVFVFFLDIRLFSVRFGEIRGCSESVSFSFSCNVIFCVNILE